MKCIETLRAIATQYGAVIDFDGLSINADLSEDGNKVWVANGLRNLCEPAATNNESWVVDAAKKITERMKCGVQEDC